MTEQKVHNLYFEAVGLLKKLIATPSLSGEESGSAAIIEQCLRDKGFMTNRNVNNVWVYNKYFDKKKPTILLNSHHDTVKPNVSYTRDPYAPKEEDGKLYGLGSNDAGGCLVSLMAAFLHFAKREDLRYNLVFAASAEEETSGRNGMEALIPKLGAIDCAIVGEPTQMEMAVAEKGLMVLDCVAEGVAGHAARGEGVNAIYKALGSIQWFGTYRFPLVSSLLGPVTTNVTIINAGTQHNVVPDRCQFVVDCRINELYTHEQVLDVIRHNVQCEVIPRSMRLRSTAISTDHPLVAAGIKLDKKYYGSPTLSDKALMPFPALKMGPGDSARSHTANEFIYLDEIHEGIDLYIQLLNELL